MAPLTSNRITVSRFKLLLCLVVERSLQQHTALAECPPQWTPPSGAVGSTDYISARTTCTSQCNEAGYCCTLGYGGCNKVPCTTGCHIAFFSSNLTACYNECDRANDGGIHSCYYTHPRHGDVGHLGWNPNWVQGGGVDAVAKCVGSSTCGCPVIVEGEQNWGIASPNECSNAACRAGCDFAASQGTGGGMYNGEDVDYDVRIGLDATALGAAIDDLRRHIDGTTPLDAAAIDAAKAVILDNGPLLPTGASLLNGALDLIDTFEASMDYGPLFINARSAGGFERNSASDGKQLERAMLQLQQSVLDEIYQGTRSISQTAIFKDRLYDSIIEECSTLLDGRKWSTADYFPGNFFGDAGDSTTVHSVTIDGTYPVSFGRPVCFNKDPGIRPTGLYLQAGKVAVVSVPPSFVSSGFKIQVGAHITNNSNKNVHLRNDRITSLYDIKSTTVHIANPLGGGIYVRVPYPSNLGVVTITITGGVVEAPYFQLTNIHNTTEAEWMTGGLRKAPAPWADIETDNFLLQVPRRWMHGYDYGHMLDLATNYSIRMDGVTEFLGFLPGETNREVLYEQPDLHIKHGAYGIGSPQVNTIVSASGTNGPQANPGVDGQSVHWLVTQPYNDDTSDHELGHARLFTKYYGEEEAAVNILLTYVQNVKFGIDLDEAFINSFPRTGLFTPDKAAINWMITENFRQGNGMDRTNSEYNEMRYQHRGYAKYADVARLYGWNAWSQLWRQEHSDYENDGTDRGQYLNDDRTFRLSLIIGEDLTPLIHFWGMPPDDSTALKALMEQNNLYPSTAVRNQLERYATLVPMNQADFIAHFDEVWPNKKDCTDCGCPSPLYGCGWYNEQYQTWDEVKANASVAAVYNLIALYYPLSMSPSKSPSKSPSTRPVTGSPTKSPVTKSPSLSPSKSPSTRPVTKSPTKSPTTSSPSKSPTSSPTGSLPVCTDLMDLSWCSKPNRCPNDKCGHYCTCTQGIPTGCTCEIDPPTTSSPTKKPTATPPSPPPTKTQTCLSQGSSCSGVTPDPCCGTCHISGKCRGGRRDRYLRQHQNSVDRNLNIFNSRLSQSERFNGPSPPTSIPFSKNGDPPGLDRSALHADMRFARAKWDARGGWAEYKFVLERVCYECNVQVLGPFDIHVKLGKISKATYVNSGDDVPLEIKVGLLSIEDFFGKIERETQSDIDHMSVDYDVVAGYPTRFVVSHFRGEGDKLELLYVRNMNAL